MRTTTVEILKARLEKGENIRLIDCREPHEYQEFNLGGLLLPLGKIQTMQIEPIEDWKEEEIIIHCRSGQRSLMAGLFLESAGYKDVVNLAGGVLAWKELYGDAPPAL
ncbi:MAG: rhodanese-like domain-containing protein [Bacteroidetes bacterium]|nr:rhodanese-like domain-containing protein [Bacteroidota bacterium]